MQLLAATALAATGIDFVAVFLFTSGASVKILLLQLLLGLPTAACAVHAAAACLLPGVPQLLPAALSLPAAASCAALQLLLSATALLLPAGAAETLCFFPLPASTVLEVSSSTCTATAPSAFSGLPHSPGVAPSSDGPLVTSAVAIEASTTPGILVSSTAFAFSPL